MKSFTESRCLRPDIRWVILGAWALTPLVFDPGAHDDAYMTPKWAWLAIWTALAGAWVVARAATPGGFLKVPMNALFAAVCAWTVWHWTACLWAASPSLAVERAARVTWMTAALWIALQWGTRRRMLGALACAAVAVALATALWVGVEDAVRAWWPQRVWLHPNLPDWRGFLSAGLGNTNHLGDLLALGLLTSVGLAAAARRPARWVGVAGALAAALIVCFSVGSNLGLLLGAGTMLVAMGAFRGEGRWWTRRRGRWIALALVWAAAVAFLTLDHPANPHRPGILSAGFASGRWHEGGPTRLAIWAETLEMIRQTPWRGVGAGNFTYLFPEMDSALLWGRPELRAYQGMWTNAAHNAVLQTWAELGVVGVAGLLAILALAFHSLLSGLGATERGERLERATLAGLLVAWVAHAQMNFCLQHPAGLLSLYALLFGTIVERRTRHGAAPAMPSFVIQKGPLAVRLDWREMTRPTAIGLGLRLGLPQNRLVGWGVGALALTAVAAFYVPHRLGPVRAQRAYRAAVAATRPPERVEEAERHFLRAFALDPDAHDCRSRYSEWLIERGRPREALDQLALVRRRLNSNELWMREARAWAALGRTDEARRAAETYYKRVWRARQMRNAATPQP